MAAFVSESHKLSQALQKFLLQWTLQENVLDEAIFKKDSFSLFWFSLKQILSSERKWLVGIFYLPPLSCWFSLNNSEMAVNLAFCSIQ